MSGSSGFFNLGGATGWGRLLAVLSALLYAAALMLPFVHGAVRILIVPVSRTLTLPAFMRHISNDQPLPVFALAVMVVFVAPALLLLAALVASLGAGRIQRGPLATTLSFLRWRSWFVVGLGVTFAAGLRAAASASGGPSLRILPGAWAFVASLVLAAAALSLAAPRRKHEECG